jgi:hypothetical protein
MKYTIFLNIEIFRFKKGEGIDVNKITFADGCISFKLEFFDSYSKGKKINFIIPYDKVNYIEEYV